MVRRSLRSGSKVAACELFGRLRHELRASCPRDSNSTRRRRSRCPGRARARPALREEFDERADRRLRHHYAVCVADKGTLRARTENPPCRADRQYAGLQHPSFGRGRGPSSSLCLCLWRRTPSTAHRDFVSASPKSDDAPLSRGHRRTSVRLRPQPSRRHSPPVRAQPAEQARRARRERPRAPVPAARRS